MQKVKEYAAVNGDVETNARPQQQPAVAQQRVAPQQPVGTQQRVAPQQPQQQAYQPRQNYYQAPQQQPVQVQQPAPAVPARTLEKIVKPEKDLVPKYTVVEEAIDSILRDGDYYEDYVRGSQAQLLESKEFVLLAVAQNYNRFYAPETPKPADWLDEMYFAARFSYFFEMTKESIKEEENVELAENLYNYFRKNAFSADSHRIVNDTLKLVAKVNLARVTSIEEGARFRNSLELFNIAVNSALNQARDKYIATVEADRIRAERLAAEKQDINDVIDAMEFDF